MWRTFLDISIKNITRRIKTMSLLFFCVAISTFALVLVWTSYDLTQKGLDLSKERMSADVIVYPYETQISDVSMLYSGVAQSVYMGDEVLEQLKNPYVNRVSYQLYLQTFPEKGCCSAIEEMRLVGVKWEEDFTVRTYLENRDIKELGETDIILGSNVDVESDNIIILNCPFAVRGRLEATGTYLDDSIILSIDQARKLAKVNFPKSYFLGCNPEAVITCALIELKDDVNANEYLESIKNVKARKVITTSMTEQVQNETTVVFSLVLGMVIIILLLCAVTLFCQIQAIIHSRYREIGYLRSIGMKKRDICIMFLIEIGIVTMSAGVMASVCGVIATKYVMGWMRQYMVMPISEWTNGFVAFHLLSGFLLTTLMVVISTFFPLRRLGKLSVQEIMTRGEV